MAIAPMQGIIETKCPCVAFLHAEQTQRYIQSSERIILVGNIE